MSSETTQHALRSIREGDRGAWSEMVCEYHAAIYRFLVHLIQEPTQAEDLTQDVFITAWQNIASFKGRASMLTWLHRIAYRKHIDFSRKQKRERAIMNNVKTGQRLLEDKPGPLARLVTRDQSLQVYTAVCNLNEPDRAAIILHYFQDLSFREMAHILGQPTGTVKWRISRALKRLRVSLDGKV